MTIPVLETKDSGNSQRCSMDIKVKQQLAWINSELERSSGSERRALAKAREELLEVMHFLADSKRPTCSREPARVFQDEGRKFS